MILYDEISEQHVVSAALHDPDRYIPELKAEGITPDHIIDHYSNRLLVLLYEVHDRGDTADIPDLEARVLRDDRIKDRSEFSVGIYNIRGRHNGDQDFRTHLKKVHRFYARRQDYNRLKTIEAAYDSGESDEKIEALWNDPPLLQAATRNETTPDDFFAELDEMVASKPERVAEMQLAVSREVYILPGIALAGQYTIINAQYNTGKTLLTLWELGQRDRHATEGYKILYVNADDTTPGGIEKCKLAESIGCHSLIPNQYGFTKDKLISLMRDAITSKAAGKVVLILDTLKKFADPNDKRAAREFNLLAREFVQAGGTLIALAHTNKNTGSNGGSIAEGVGDWASDCDCQYIVDEVDTPDSQKAIVFKNEKLRGANRLELNYIYDGGEGTSWQERFDSVERLGKGEAKALLSDLEADKRHAEDMATIQYLEGRIYAAQGPIAETALTQNDLGDGLPTKSDRKRVLIHYADTNPRPLHRHWRRRTGPNNNGHVYTPPESMEPF